MDQNFQTSFIPKKPIVKETVSTPKPVGGLLVLALLILFAVLLATGGLYFYQIYLTKDIITLQDNLEKAKNRFEPQKITELQVLGKRLSAASEILSKHITIVPVFNVLQELTLKTVRYTKFTYELGPDNKTLKVKMSGIARGYLQLALQAELFAAEGIGKNLLDPTFSNLTLDNIGNVVFDLNFSVEPSFVNYKQTFLTRNES